MFYPFYSLIFTLVTVHKLIIIYYHNSKRNAIVNFLLIFLLLFSSFQNHSLQVVLYAGDSDGSKEFHINTSFHLFYRVIVLIYTILTNKKNFVIYFWAL